MIYIFISSLPGTMISGIPGKQGQSCPQEHKSKFKKVFVRMLNYVRLLKYFLT